MATFYRSDRREQLFLQTSAFGTGTRVPITGRDAALTLLRELGGEPCGHAALRLLYGELVGRTAVCWETDQQVLERLAQWMVTEQIKVRHVRIPPIEVPVGALLPVEPAPAPQKTAPKQLRWFEIELMDDSDPPAPVAGAKFRVELPDGRVIEGQLNDDGKAKIEVEDPSQCKVSFPDFDHNEWTFG